MMRHGCTSAACRVKETGREVLTQNEPLHVKAPLWTDLIERQNETLVTQGKQTNKRTNKNPTLQNKHTLKTKKQTWSLASKKPTQP